MNQSAHSLTGASFAKTFVLPALLVFLVPVLSYLFFLHAQSTFNSDALENILGQIQADTSLAEPERERLSQFYREHPVSELMDDEAFTTNISSETIFHYATFRWSILISAGSVLTGLGVFVLAGLFVLLSLRSPMAQYLSLSVGWHLLRLYAALQAVVQGALLIALSYWVTALWLNVYVIKLIVVVAIMALFAVGILIKAMFKRVSTQFEVDGQVITNDQEMPLWQELKRICTQLDTEPPDQVIVGINDSFFVTEHPVTVADRTYTGRSLFVSLSLLKQLHGGEADAVLAHEMAHFSGNDTLFSRRISPLLVRYENYLVALSEGGVTLPIYYFMLCFRGLYELSLSKLSREREARADRLASHTTEARYLAGALLRISAYSTYRGTVEENLFMEQEALQEANVSERIEAGFPAYAVSFLEDPAVEQMRTSHPFDSHPPLNMRLAELGAPLGSAETEAILAEPGDGRWFGYIQGAADLERQMWDTFEQQFQSIHKESLPYRFLPDTAEEQVVVEAAFPPITFQGEDGTLTLDFEKMTFTGWTEPLVFPDITTMSLNDSGQLIITRDSGSALKFKTTKFNLDRQEILDAINKYYGRYLAAVEFKQFSGGG